MYIAHPNVRRRNGKGGHAFGIVCFLLMVALLAGALGWLRMDRQRGAAQAAAQYERKELSMAGAAYDVPVDAGYAILYDAENNQLLYEKNATQRCEPASLTKLLTVLTACENGGESLRYLVGEEIDHIGDNSSVAYLRQGDELSFEAIVDAVLLSSGNDATYALAVNVARHQAGQQLSVEEALSYFAGLMNATAQRIGCVDSHFVTVDGYPDAGHYATAQDLLRIALAAAESPVVADAMGKSRAYHMFYSGREVVWETTNELLRADSDYAYPYATGMKTGSASASSYSLAASAEKDGQQLIAILVASGSNDARFRDAISLFDYGFQ